MTPGTAEGGTVESHGDHGRGGRAWTRRPWWRPRRSPVGPGGRRTPRYMAPAAPMATARPAPPAPTGRGEQGRTGQLAVAGPARPARTGGATTAPRAAGRGRDVVRPPRPSRPPPRPEHTTEVLRPGTRPGRSLAGPTSIVDRARARSSSRLAGAHGRRACPSAWPTTGPSDRTAVRVVLFSGTVRDHADGRTGVTSLTYEAYEGTSCPAWSASPPSCAGAGRRPGGSCCGTVVGEPRPGRVLGGGRRLLAPSGGGLRGGPVRHRRAQGVGADLEEGVLGRRCGRGWALGAQEVRPVDDAAPAVARARPGALMRNLVYLLAAFG